MRPQAMKINDENKLVSNTEKRTDWPRAYTIIYTIFILFYQVSRTNLKTRPIRPTRRLLCIVCIDCMPLFHEGVTRRSSDGRTDRRTVKPLYRKAKMHVKTVFGHKLLVSGRDAIYAISWHRHNLVLATAPASAFHHWARIWISKTVPRVVLFAL